jgi:hypothetical protein
MRIAVIALKKAADARMNTRKIILLSHSNLSLSVIKDFVLARRC